MTNILTKVMEHCHWYGRSIIRLIIVIFGAETHLCSKRCKMETMQARPMKQSAAYILDKIQRKKEVAVFHQKKVIKWAITFIVLSY